MGRKKHNYFNESALANNATYWQYFNRLKELAISQFKWINIPISVDIRYLETVLFDKGQAVFFKDDVLGYLGLDVILSGKFNVYNIPTMRRAIASNGYNKQLNEYNSVVIYNNYLHTNSLLDVKNYAYRLYNLDRIIDVNANAQKTPVLLIADEKERLSMINVYKEYDGNAPVIFGNKSLNPDNLTVLKTDAPYVADKIYELKTQIWNEALTYLGIANLNLQKKERLISDEVQRSVGGTIASRYSRLQARKEACAFINQMFGLELDVEYRQDAIDKSVDEPLAMHNTEGGATDE